jgi:hypothetical protein
MISTPRVLSLRGHHFQMPPNAVYVGCRDP